MLFAGLDMGTQGARVIIADERGRVVGEGQKALPASALAGGGSLPLGWFEQDPAAWWEATRAALNTAAIGCRDAGLDLGQIASVAVTSTSGTIVPVDEGGRYLRPAIMYNDARAQDEAREVQAKGAGLAERLGYRFNASFALPKWLWLARHEPGVLDKARWLVHAADFIAGRLTGDFGRSDYSNALKTGYDLLEDRWPDFIGNGLGLPLQKFPRVVAPGQPIGRVTRQAAEATGLPEGAVVVGGMTDGCAGQVASGAVRPGDGNSTLGTTLTIKAISPGLVRDPKGRVYCHRHPQGFWMPGGASNTGGEYLARHFAGQNLARLDEAAARIAPSSLVLYPNLRPGERFPFANPQAGGFALRKPAGQSEHFLGALEGVALVERQCYDVLTELGSPLGERVYVTGKASRSEVWLTIRASVLNRTLVRPRVGEAAMGMAILAASSQHFPDLNSAAAAMVQIDRTVEPNPAWVEPYEEKYQAFVHACRERGYIS